MRAATLGSFRKTLDSVSIAVETARPVSGHLIITELMPQRPPNCLNRTAEQTAAAPPLGLNIGWRLSRRRREPIARACVDGYIAGRLPPYPPNSRLAKRPRVYAR